MRLSTEMRKSALQLGLFALFFAAGTPPATATDIADVQININDVATDIGDISATVAGGDNIMDGRFTVAAAWNGQSGANNICNWVKFHWVQIATAAKENADCRPTWNGSRAFALPMVDPPNDGFDYHRLGDDNETAFRDAQPWYWTAAAEAGGGGVGPYSNPCKTFDIADDKTDVCPAPGITWRTWLVAETGTNQFCLIRGYQWSVSAAGATQPADLGAPNDDHETQVGDALTNGGIAGWTVSNKCSITNCSANCKQGPPGSRFAKTQLECHSLCDDICGGSKDNVFSCFFKGANVKGNCEVFCKDLTEDHITLEKPTEAACHAACDTFCGGNKNVFGCFLKGALIKGKAEPIPTLSEWGLVVLTLIGLAAGTILLRRRNEDRQVVV